MEKIEKFTLINKDRSRIKVVEPFEDVSKPSPTIDAMMISYLGCLLIKIVWENFFLIKAII